MKVVRLGVNIDHVATLRQARGTTYPDPVQAALIVEKAGAYSVVAHLREDRRHIQDRDLFSIKKRLRRAKLNLEMSIAGEVVDAACRLVPDQITLVPERRQELTTEGGLDLRANRERVEKAVHRLKKKGMRISLFIEPSLPQIAIAYSTGADTIELHTGKYAGLTEESEIRRELAVLIKAAGYARSLGFKEIAAGHGLHYDNIGGIVSLGEIDEFNIGHSIIAEAVFVGLSNAVKRMQRLIQKSV